MLLVYKGKDGSIAAVSPSGLLHSGLVVAVRHLLDRRLHRHGALVAVCFFVFVCGIASLAALLWICGLFCVFVGLECEAAVGYA